MPTTNPFADWPRPLGFVMSGGGGFGSVQVGMLRALIERSIRPDLVVGSSVGALHGALLATDSGSTVDTLDQLWRTTDRRAVFGGRRNLLLSALRTRTLSDASRLGSLISTHLPTDSFDDLSIPFAAVATDALTGEPELIDTGSLRSALLASAAVPGLFPSVEIYDRLYVDGGVSANVPIRQAIAFGAASVISLDATPAVVSSRVPRSLTGSLLHSASLMLRNQRSHAVDELAHRYRIAVLPSPTPPDMGSFNFDHTGHLLETSYEQAAAALDRWAEHPDAFADSDLRDSL